MEWAYFYKKKSHNIDFTFHSFSTDMRKSNHCLAPAHKETLTGSSF